MYLSYASSQADLSQIVAIFRHLSLHLQQCEVAKFIIANFGKNLFKIKFGFSQ